MRHLLYYINTTSNEIYVLGEFNFNDKRPLLHEPRKISPRKDHINGELDHRSAASVHGEIYTFVKSGTSDVCVLQLNVGNSSWNECARFSHEKLVMLGCPVSFGGKIYLWSISEAVECGNMEFHEYDPMTKKLNYSKLQVDTFEDDYELGYECHHSVIPAYFLI